MAGRLPVLVALKDVRLGDVLRRDVVVVVLDVKLIVEGVEKNRLELCRGFAAIEKRFNLSFSDWGEFTKPG